MNNVIESQISQYISDRVIKNRTTLLSTAHFKTPKTEPRNLLNKPKEAWLNIFVKPFAKTDTPYTIRINTNK